MAGTTTPFFNPTTLGRVKTFTQGFLFVGRDGYKRGQEIATLAAKDFYEKTGQQLTPGSAAGAAVRENVVAALGGIYSVLAQDAIKSLVPGKTLSASAGRIALNGAKTGVGHLFLTQTAMELSPEVREMTARKMSHLAPTWQHTLTRVHRDLLGKDLKAFLQVRGSLAKAMLLDVLGELADLAKHAAA